ncbi:MAG: phosphatidate cytidylyltransferase [Lachnospiraceae bacterium]|jgi:phosphatidate cytidylyltransferase|nr:phosphatidate cytidylyltransferase [Lachnospiraceae bacterium]
MFWVRLRSGIILVILALVTMFAGGKILLATMIFLSVIAYWELCGATGVRGEGKKDQDAGRQKREEVSGRWKKNGLETVGLLGIILYYTLLWVNEETELLSLQTGMLFSIICVFMGGMFVYVFGFPKFQASQVLAAFFSFFYGPVCLSFIYLTRELGFGTAEEGNGAGLYVVWLILLCSWGCDTCAYCAGMLFGKHKMSPVLSPKKSVEGAVGGVIGAAALGALYGFVIRERFGDERVILFFALICSVGALISMVGDLAASAVKRNADIKDYGKLIPGHGGVMDRFDSVIFTAPVIYFMTVFLLA